mgnify:FL=1|jgi:hypothetical protein
MYTSNNNFDFNSIPAEKPASWNQLKSRVGNPATDYLFNQLGLNGDRTQYKSTNGKLFNQMGSAIKTATIKKPLNNGDVRAIAKGLTKAYKDIFNNAFKELYLEANDLGNLLLKDGLTAKEAQKVVVKYCAITGKTAVEKSVKVTARKKVKSDKSFKVLTGKELTPEQIADKMAKLLEQVAILDSL